VTTSAHEGVLETSDNPRRADSSRRDIEVAGTM